MAKELSKIVKIEDEDYNINAKYSDEAGKVTETLVIKESGEERYAFNGSDNAVIDYVPATGGTFRGPVYKSEPTNNPTANELITSAQVDNKVVNLNGSPICVWNTALSGANLEKSLYSLVDGTDKFYKFTTITGTEADFYLLQGVLTSSNTELNYSLVNTISPALGWKATGLSADASGIVVVPDEHTGTYNTSTYTNPVREIGPNAFKGKTKIISVLLPDGETETESLTKGIRIIGNYAFQGCTSLKSIVIPNSTSSTTTAGGTTTVEGWFDGCTNLKNVILGKKLASIGAKLFQNCTSLTSIVIPTNITSIGANAFSGCTNLKTIYYAGSETQWSSISISSTGNDALSSAVKVYDYTPPAAEATVGSPINLAEVSNGPFIYICKDDETSLPVSNKVFLKLPNSNEIVEISKGADRLNSTAVASENYYTYEGLAEIIARINTRLDGLGIPVKSTALVKNAPLTINDVNDLVPDIDITNTEISKDDFTTDMVPTIEQLTAAIVKLNGSTWNMSATASENLVNILSTTDNIASLRRDLNDLTTEVAYDLNGGDSGTGVAIDYANTRIDKLTVAITAEQSDRANKDAELTSSIETLTTNLSEETDARTTGDEKLSTSLTKFMTAVEQELTTNKLTLNGSNSSSSSIDQANLEILLKLASAIDSIV